MISYIVHFFLQNQTKNKVNMFNKKYRNGYNKLWINNIQNYKP
jgi:hypothetical protein